MWLGPKPLIYQQAIYIIIYHMCHALDFNGNILLIECEDFGRKCCITIKTPFTQRTDFYRKKLPQDNRTTAMLNWCLKQLKDFILKFSKSIFELVHCNTSFFSFRSMWLTMRQLKKLSWIQRWCIFPSVSYIGSHIFHESWRTLSNYHN